MNVVGMLVITSIMLQSCGPDNLSPEEIEIVVRMASGGSIQPGDTRQFIAEARDKDHKKVDVGGFSWEVSDMRRATINASGLLTALEAGPVVVTARADAIEGDLPIVIDPPVVTTVTVTSEANITPEPGDSVIFRAVATDKYQTVVENRPIAWTTSDVSVATIDEQGVLRAEAAGEVTVTAVIDEVAGQSDLVVIPAVVVRVVFEDPELLELETGDTVSLRAFAFNKHDRVIAGRPIVWSVSDLEVATIDANGYLVALSPGTVVVTASVDGVEGNQAFTIFASSARSIVISSADSSDLFPHDQRQYTALGLDKRGNPIDVEIEWSVSDTSVAVIDTNGLLTVKNEGPVTVIASAEGLSAEVTLDILPAVVTDVAVSASSQGNLEPGDERQFVAAAMDRHGQPVEGRTMSWRVGIDSLARVNSNGLVHALRPGSTLVYASIDGVEGSAPLSIDPAVVVSVTVTSDGTGPLEPGDHRNFTARATDKYGAPVAGRNVEWAVSDTTLAIIDSTGHLLALGQGQGTVTATVESTQGEIQLIVDPAKVVSVTVTTQDSSDLVVGDERQYTAIATDKYGRLVTGRTVLWGTSHPRRAFIDDTGKLLATNIGAVSVDAEIDGVVGSLDAAVILSWIELAEPALIFDEIVAVDTVLFGRTNLTVSRYTTNSWTELPLGVNYSLVTDMDADNATLYIATEDWILRSSNYGESFQQYFGAFTDTPRSLDFRNDYGWAVISRWGPASGPNRFLPDSTREVVRAGMEWSYVGVLQRIVADHADPEFIAYTYGIRGDSGPRYFRTSDAGVTWTKHPNYVAPVIYTALIDGVSYVLSAASYSTDRAENWHQMANRFVEYQYDDEAGVLFGASGSGGIYGGTPIEWANAGLSDHPLLCVTSGGGYVFALTTSGRVFRAEIPLP